MSLTLSAYLTPMSTNRMRDEAIKLAGEAVELDKASKWPEALEKYMQAIERFLHVIKCESPVLAESRNLAVRTPHTLCSLRILFGYLLLV
jgi:hypothetical protein